MSQSLLNKAIYARTMNGVIILSDGTLEIQNGNISNAKNLDATNITSNYLKTQLLDISSNVQIDGGLNIKGNLVVGTNSSNAHTINGKMTFNDTLPECSIVPNTNNQLVNYAYTNNTYGKLAGANSWTGTNTFAQNSAPITVQNTLWVDGSGAIPASNTFTTMFSNVKNSTITVQGWSFTGTAISTINGFGADWVNGDPGDYNHYGGAGPGAGPYWMSFYCSSPGTTQSNSTFYLEAPPTLAAGMYFAEWYSKFNAGTQYTSTSLNVSIGGGSILLSYNDSDTRNTNVYRYRSIIFEVTTAGRMRWTYKDTQATANQFFAATISNLKITSYPAIKINDATLGKNTYLSGSLNQINGAYLVGTNQINGTLSMVGIPTFTSSKGSNNLVMNSSFTQAANATLASSNIVMGTMAYYAENFQNCILMGYNGMTNGANQQKVATDCIVMGSNAFGGYSGDIMLGVGCSKGYTATANGGGECVLIGWYLGESAGTYKNMTRSVGIGTQIWRGYPNSFTTEMVENVAVGANILTSNNQGWFGSYTTALGADSMRMLRGNTSTASYNTAVGYRAGVDPRCLPFISPNQTYTQSVYSYQTFVGAYARTNGTIDLSGCQFGTAIGYNAQTDASYCTVIGADASYNVQNTIRLGRAQDKTVVSSLWSMGNIDISGVLTCAGGIADSSLSGNVALKNAANTFSLINTFQQPIVPYKFINTITAIGYNVLAAAPTSNEAGANSVYIGDNVGAALNSIGTSNNTMVGSLAGSSLKKATGLTLIGYSAGGSLTGATESFNSTSIGYLSLGSLTRIKHSITIGTYSFTGIITNTNDWDYNVVIGGDAFGTNDCFQSQKSVFIGYKTGSTNTNTAVVNQNVVIGQNGKVAGNYSNSVAISGSDPIINASNTFYIGDDTNTYNNVLSNRISILQSQNSLINSGTTLTFPVYSAYSVSATTTFTITLPTIADKHLGTEILFRRVGGTTTTIVSFIGNGTQKVYNTALTGGGTAQSLMGSGVYIVRLIALVDGVAGTYAWFQI